MVMAPRNSIPTQPKTMFSRDFLFWQNAVTASNRQMRSFMAVWQNYLAVAGAPYYHREDQKEGFGTNWHYPTARSVVANLMFQDPQFEFVNPNPEYADSALAQEKIMEKLWMELQWSRVMRMVMYYAYFTGYGATRTEFITGLDAPQQLTPSKEKIDDIFRTLRADNDGSINGAELARLIEGVGEPVYQNRMERRGFPSWRRVRSSQFLMDPDVVEMDFNEARWMGERIWLPLEFVRNTELYDKRPRNRVEGTHRVRTSLFDRASFADADDLMVEVHEIIDKVNGRILTMQMEQEIVLRSRPFQGEDVYDVLFWNPLPEQKMPLPDAALVFEHAQAKSAVRSRINRIVDTHRLMLQYDRDMIGDVEGLTALFHGNDGTPLPIVVPQGKKLSDAILPERSLPIPQELFFYDNNLTGEIMQATGVSSTSSGQSIRNVRTAAQVSSEQVGDITRLGDKGLEVDAFLGRHAARTMKLVRGSGGWSPEMIATFSGMRDNDSEVRAYFQQIHQLLKAGVDPTSLPVVMPRKTIIGEFTAIASPGSTAADSPGQIQLDRLVYLDMLQNPFVSNRFASMWYFRRRRIRGIEAAMPATDDLAGRGEFMAAGGPGDPLAQPQGLSSGGEAPIPQGAGEDLSIVPRAG